MKPTNEALKNYQLSDISYDKSANLAKATFTEDLTSNDKSTLKEIIVDIFGIKPGWVGQNGMVLSIPEKEFNDFQKLLILDLQMKLANEAQKTRKVNRNSFVPVGAMIKDYKESWNSREMNRESKLVPGGEWVDVNTGGDSDMMVCVTPQMKKALPKDDSLYVFTMGDLMWDQDKKDFVTIVEDSKGNEHVFWFKRGKGVQEVLDFMENGYRVSGIDEGQVVESFSSVLRGSQKISEAGKKRWRTVNFVNGTQVKPANLSYKYFDTEDEAKKFAKDNSKPSEGVEYFVEKTPSISEGIRNQVVESVSSSIKRLVIEAVDSNGEELEEGDVVEITGPVHFQGKTGKVVEMSSMSNFVIVEVAGQNYSFAGDDLTKQNDEEDEDDIDFDDADTFEYVIDLDERGDFRAHVEDQNGNVIFEIEGIDDLESLIEDGFMKHKNDTDGLLQHLQDIDILDKNDILESFDSKVDRFINENGEGPLQYYPLSDGRNLCMDIIEGSGMAGEPIEMVHLSIDDQVVNFDDVKDLMNPDDAEELQQYIDDVNTANDASAKSFVESNHDQLPLDSSEPEYEVTVPVENPRDEKTYYKIAQKLGIEGAPQTGFIVATKTLLKNFINTLRGFDLMVDSIIDAKNREVQLASIPTYKQRGRPTNKYNYPYRMRESKTGAPDAGPKKSHLSDDFEGEVLYQTPDGKYSVEIAKTKGSGGPKKELVVVKDQMQTDWVMVYDDGSVAYDAPERIPQKVKDVVAKAAKTHFDELTAHRNTTNEGKLVHQFIDDKLQIDLRKSSEIGRNLFKNMDSKLWTALESLPNFENIDVKKGIATISFSKVDNSVISAFNDLLAQFELDGLPEHLMHTPYDLEQAKQDFESDGRAHFNANDDAEMEAFYALIDHLKEQGIEYGETNIVPSQYTVYDVTKFDSNLRKI